MERLLLVAAFAQIGFSAGLRPFKCLNPVMGETFEARLCPQLTSFLVLPAIPSFLS